MPEKTGATGSWPAESKVYRFAEMNARKNGNGSESRDMGAGALITGEHVRVHQTKQVAGLPPNPAHTNMHTEFICIREGTLEFIHDGKTETAEAGDVLFVAKGSMHQARNIGTGAASYFVIAIGGDA